MLLRYKDTDYMTYKEDELLFNGTPKECEQYLLKNWSVDILQVKDNLELQATMCDYLSHIWYDKTEWKDSRTGNYTAIEKLQNNPLVMDDSICWKQINPNKFIFNRGVEVL